MSSTHIDDPVAWAIAAFRDGRNILYDKYESYIIGDQPLSFASPKFESAFGRLFSEFAYNRCEMAVDAHADRLQIAGFSADDDAIATAAQFAWDSNRMDTREGHMYRDAFGLGDSYVIVEKNPRTNKVLYWVNQPQSMRVHWNDDAPDTIDLAAKYWLDDDEHGNLTIYLPGEIRKYITRTRAKSGIPRSPSMFDRREVEGETWPLKLDVPDQVPVFHVPNNGRTSAYGVSELRSVLPLQDALNKTVMDMMVAMELVAFPQRVMIGVDAPQTPEEEAMVRAFEGGMTRLWTMANDNGKIAEFSAANIAQFIAVADYFDKAISRVTKIPYHWLGMSSEAESGRARRVSESPFVVKIEDRQKGFGYTVSEVQRYGLRLQGMDVKPGEIRVNWNSAESVSDEDVLDMQITKKAVGYPFVSILRESGYEPEQIDTIMQEAREASDAAAMMFSRGLPVALNESAA